MRRVPYVRLQEKNRGVCASAGFALRAILSERLMTDSDRLVSFTDRLHSSHQDAVRLLQCMASLSSELIVELHIVSRPCLDVRGVSRVDVAVRIEVRDRTNVEALEKCLSTSLSFASALEAFWRNAEFEAITQTSEFDGCFMPFMPESCLAIGRRVQSVSLSRPFEKRGRAVGFQPDNTPPGSDFCTVQHLFPWIPPFDDWSALLRTMLSSTVPLWIVARVGNRPDISTAVCRLETTASTCERFLACAPPDQTTLTHQVMALRDLSLRRLLHLDASAFESCVILRAPGKPDDSVAGVLGQSLSGDVGRGLTENPFEGGFRIEQSDACRAFEFFDEEPWTATEVACAFRLPLILSDDSLGLPVRRYRTMATPGLPPTTHRLVTRLGVGRHRGVDRPIEVDLQQRLRHVALFGMTGSGKSTMMESMFLQDLRAGHGCCFIDPHGDSANQILSHFPEERQEDLILIDLEDHERPIPLNLLEWKTIEERDLIIDEMLATLLRIYRDPSMFGPIFEQNFRSVMKLLMGDKTDRSFTPTLLEFPKVYLSAAFRRHLASLIDDEQVKDFVAESERVSYGDGKLENLAPYITNKFGRFLQDTLLRRIVGHGSMALDFRRIIDEGKVVILKLARGRFGSTVADLVASQIVRRFRWAAMSRRSQRRAYFIYVDEFGTLAGDDTFSHLLSESRKYGIGLVLATQYTKQLREADAARNALSAVLGNVGTILCYRVGAEDAPLLAPLFAPGISAQDLLECPNWQGYIRLHTNDCATRPFSFHNQIESVPPDLDLAARLIQVNRDRWGVPAAACDQRAVRRSQWIKSLDAAT